jgi:hypothetical protein
MSSGFCISLEAKRDFICLFFLRNCNNYFQIILTINVFYFLNPLLARRGGTNEYATKEQTIEGRGGGIKYENHHPVSRHSLCSV